jgi:hypothetical protein
MITTDMLGRAKVPDMNYENSDGFPLTIHTGYFGHSRNATNPMQGPFELPEPKLQLKIWPRK